MGKQSAGVLPYRKIGGLVEVLIGHPGGPFWARKDDGAWSVIKGEYTPEEDPEDAARREFREETGVDVPAGALVRLPEIRQRGGKVVTVFAIEADVDISQAVSNTFEMEWPPKSGTMQSFPEMDRVQWFPVADARVKLLAAQAPILDSLPAR
ncbi:MAG: NUDIX domain-containing protein [Rhodococcus sp. (in: high G+C Gram-positive bacteria)]